MCRATLRKLRGDASPRELVPMRLRIIPAVPLDQARFARRAPRPSTQRRNGIDQGQQLGDVVPVGGGQSDDERDPLRVREEMVFAPRLAAIGWVRSSFFPRAARGPTNCRPPHGPNPTGRGGAVRRAALRGCVATRPPAARRPIGANRPFQIHSPSRAATCSTGSRCGGQTECRSGRRGRELACARRIGDCGAGVGVGAVRLGPIVRHQVVAW